MELTNVTFEKWTGFNFGLELSPYSRELVDGNEISSVIVTENPFISVQGRSFFEEIWVPLYIQPDSHASLETFGDTQFKVDYSDGAITLMSNFTNFGSNSVISRIPTLQHSMSHWEIGLIPLTEVLKSPWHILLIVLMIGIVIRFVHSSVGKSAKILTQVPAHLE